jgi:hypothetical protein
VACHGEFNRKIAKAKSGGEKREKGEGGASKRDYLNSFLQP